MIYQLSYYVPCADHERVKQALFDKGAGTMGRYAACCWEIKGSGQFQPLAGSQPSIGQVDQLTRLDEYKVEMVCQAEFIEQVVDALLEQHPYEQPAYFVTKAMTKEDFGRKT